MKKITTKNMVIVAMILGIYLVVKIIQELFIPSFILGQRIQLIDITVAFSSVIIGFRKSVLAVLIYVWIIVWMAPSFFIAGVTYVKGGIQIFGEYILDYVIPLLILAFIPSLYSYFKNKLLCLLLFICLAYLATFISHVCAGVIFWSSYAWKGYGPLAYSTIFNSIWTGTSLGISLIISAPTLMILLPYMKRVLKYEGY